MVSLEAMLSRKRQQTQEKLIAAAIVAIGSRGFQNSSLDEIAAQAGVTKGAVYSNFRSKEDLFLAVARSMKLGFEPQLAAHMSLADLFHAIGEAVAKALPTARAHVAFIAEYQLLALTDPKMRERLAKSYEETLLSTVRQIPSGIVESELPLPPRQLAVVIQSLALGLIQQHQLTPRLVTRAVVIAAFDALGRSRPRPAKA
jgi:AcrR family transcriptional regulator